MVCRCILKNNTSAGELDHIQGVSGGIVNILGVGTMDYSECSDTGVVNPPMPLICSTSRITVRLPLFPTRTGTI